MLTFKEILGHEQIKEHFRNALLSQKISHAYILSGEEGMGRKSLANAFALTLLCEREMVEPCMECPACKQVLSGSHPDLIYVTHEKPASIGVDDIRKQINDTIQVRPYSSTHKIYIVDEAEKMTQQAQNALLKTIEEPPEYAIIMLLTTNTEAFLPTILSRCVQMKLKPLRDSVVKDYLKDRLGVSEMDAEVYAAFARGNLGKAITIASSESFKELHREILKLLKGIREMDISQILDWIKMLKDEEYDIYECLDFIQMWYRDILLYKVTNDINLLIFKDEDRAIREISSKSSYEGLEKVLEAVDQARVRMDANVNMELAVELLLLAMKEN
jgi:DNA polymerase-3 subunit delta'